MLSFAFGFFAFSVHVVPWHRLARVCCIRSDGTLETSISTGSFTRAASELVTLLCRPETKIPPGNWTPLPVVLYSGLRDCKGWSPTR